MELGGDRASTADPSWPEGCPKSHGTVLNGKPDSEGRGLSWEVSLLGVWLGSKQLHCASAVLYVLSSFSIPFLSY